MLLPMMLTSCAVLLVVDILLCCDPIAKLTKPVYLKEAPPQDTLILTPDDKFNAQNHIQKRHPGKIGMPEGFALNRAGSALNMQKVARLPRLGA